MMAKYGVNATLGECDAGVADLVMRAGFAHVLRVAIQAKRDEAGRQMAEAEKEFELLGRVAVAAGLEDETGEPDKP